MSYTKDFLESKSHTYPEILKMTDEEALRYLDFMGELVESVDDSPTDIDYGYNLGGRVGFMNGGDQDGPTGAGGVSPGPGGPGGGMVAGASPDGQGGSTGGTSEGFGGNTGGSNNGVSPDPQPSAEDVYGISPNLGIAAETQKDRFSPDSNKGLGIVNAFKTLSPTLNALRALGYLKDRVESFFGYNAGEDPGNLGLSYSPAPNSVVDNLGMTPIGTDVSPSSDPDRGGRADERRVENVLDTELPIEMMFGGDPLKIATYQRYLDAGYPEDQARLIADSLMTNYTP